MNIGEIINMKEECNKCVVNGEVGGDGGSRSINIRGLPGVAMIGLLIYCTAGLLIRGRVSAVTHDTLLCAQLCCQGDTQL